MQTHIRLNHFCSLSCVVAISVLSLDDGELTYHFHTVCTGEGTGPARWLPWTLVLSIVLHLQQFADRGVSRTSFFVVVVHGDNGTWKVLPRACVCNRPFYVGAAE